MKKKILAIILCTLLAVCAVFNSGCTGCFSDTTTSGTKYELLMISELPHSADGNNAAVIDTSDFRGAVWQGIKDAANTDGLKYKYFPPAKAVKTESVSYLRAFSDTVTQQLSLAVTAANTDNKPVIILPGDEFVPAYMAYQESNTKVFGNIYTMIVGASPLSDAANTGKTNEKCYTMVIDYTAMAYLSGYTAVTAGYTKIGYLGYDDALTKSMLEGLILGAEKAAADKGLANGSVEVKYSYATSPDDTANADELFASCDIVMPENSELQSLLLSCAGDKAVIGVTEKTDGAVKLSYHVSSKRLSELVKAALQSTVRGISTGVVNKVGISENMFNYTAADGFSYSSADADSLMKTVSTDESVTATGDINGLRLSYVKPESK